MNEPEKTIKLCGSIFMQDNAFIFVFQCTKCVEVFDTFEVFREHLPKHYGVNNEHEMQYLLPDNDNDIISIETPYEEITWEMELCEAQDEVKKRAERKLKRKRKKVRSEDRSKREDCRLAKRLELDYIEDYMIDLGMEPLLYEELLEKVSPYIKRQDTIMRSSITPNERLFVTLKYLSTGQPFSAIKLDAYLGTSTVSQIVIETCGVIIKVLKDYIELPKNSNEWLVISDAFEEKCNFPNCMGAMDGKHIRIIKPRESAPHYMNHEKTYSIVLTALVNANYEFTMVDVEANARVSDSAVFPATTFYHMYKQDQLEIPMPRSLPNLHKKLPFVFAAIEAFGMTENVLKPYKNNVLTKEETYFNYRLDKVRQIAENTFNIMSSRFKVLLSVILLNPEKTTQVVLAICYLHNFLMKRSRTSYLPDIHVENILNANAKTPVSLSADDKSSTSSGIAKATRNDFRDYFNNFNKLQYIAD